MKAVWAVLYEEKKLSMSYQTFRYYCREARRGKTVSAAQAHQDASRSATAVSAKADAPMLPLHDAPQRGFRHQRVPRREDIYG
jgi:hypothetical protein